MHTHMTAAGDSIPLWLLYEDEVGGWCAAQPPAVAQWLGQQGFKGERHRVVALAGEGGAVAGAVAGLGRRQGPLSLWHAAGIAERLPARRFRLAQRFTEAEATQICLGFAHAAYRFDRYRPAKSETATLEAPLEADARHVALAAEGSRMARDWINTPTADFGPPELTAAVRQVAERHGAVCREWVGEELLAANLPAIHAVGRASADAPRLIELRWSPPDGADLPRLTLVGKGVCFDSGGLDIKPSSGMALMKKDMGGAAVALALAHMLMSAQARVDLRLLIPAVENAISGDAYRPGDVLATHKGLTVEVGNTDAEGRLVLCDALALADEEHPHLIIDFATLTGAARVALGPDLPALFGSDEGMVRDLARIAAEEHDPLWPMPLWAPYDEELSSRIADLNNVSASAFAGAIFGALFLKRFVADATPWMHIDLYAWNPRDRPGRGVGAEAQGLRAVFRYLVRRFGAP
ncbi:MAG TPA: leucyl aminopeptidase family protein [Steroidobacteraceae bacterium]|nr:leucyl aminopeptidase family protein [Steroidobacteraceae bacterium]